MVKGRPTLLNNFRTKQKSFAREYIRHFCARTELEVATLVTSKMYQMTETSYKLALKKNLVYEYCHQGFADSSSSFSDLVFVAKGNVRIDAGPAIIIALSSSLIRSFHDEKYAKSLVVLLPEFCPSVVNSLIKLLYTGETYIDEELRDDFISLCRELMVEIPGLVDSLTASFTHDAVKAEEQLIEFDEDEIEALTDDLVDVKDLSSGEYEGSAVTDTDSIVVNVQQSNSEPGGSEEKKGHRRTSHNSTRDRIEQAKHSKPSTPPYVNQNLKRAIAEIRDENKKTMDVARKYGLPKSTLYRWVKRAKK